MIYYYDKFGGLLIETQQFKKQNDDSFNYSYLKDDLSKDISNFKINEEPSDDKQLFRCLYCEKYFTAEHINPYVQDTSEFPNMKNFNHWDDVDQGHLCEPYQIYCRKRERELKQKNVKMQNNKLSSSLDYSEFKTTLHGKVNHIEQVIDEQKVDDKPTDFPDNFDEWYQRKIQEKRQL